MRRKEMNILLVNVPSRKGEGGYMTPLGLLYVGSIVERCGHNAKIIDLYSGDVNLNSFNCCCLDKIIEDFKPSIIGYGGIATSYGRTKQLSIHIKNKYTDIIQIAGGPLASVYKLLLQKAKIDVVFHGETEINLPIFLKKLEKSESFNDLLGISYVVNGIIIRNSPVEQIKNLDTIPFPAYHLINMYDHLLLDKKSGKKYIYIISSRGCTHKCIFCYRHIKGIRQHSVDYVVNHIKYLKETYNITYFMFSDELFNISHQWIFDFCNKLEKNNLNIIYIVGGARVNNIDKDMLQRLKKTGCIGIQYGQESGSDVILKEIKKGVTALQNKEITNLTREMGINSVVQLCIGSPSETTETIYETIKFLKDTDSYCYYSLNYLIPLPETPIWKYVEENNLIGDVEIYLDRIAEVGGYASVINLTKQPDFIWRSWDLYIKFEMKSYHYKKTNQKKKYLINRIIIIFIPLISITSYLMPKKSIIRETIKNLLLEEKK